MGLSIAEWADHLGISRQAAYKRIKSGKVTLLPDGTVDPAAAEKQWAANRDELQTQRGAKQVGRSAAPVAPPSGKQETADVPDKQNGTTFADLQRAEKALKIKRDQLRLKREEGKLLDADEVRAAWAEMISSVRAQLLPIGTELADNLVGEQDVVTIREEIDRRVHKALSALAEYPPTPSE